MNSGVRAYATSKLCNLLTAAALASSPFAKERALHVLAFNPGWTPGTQLARSLPRAIRFLFSVLMPILTPFLRPNTVAGGGQLLADLALGTLIPPAGRLYASQVKRQLTWPAPSDLACDQTVKTSLWRDSAALVGLSAEA